MCKIVLKTLEDKCFLLALAESPLGPLVKMVMDGVPREGPSGPLVKIVMDGLLMML